MDAKRVLLIKYGEIALRKGNRVLFERRLMAQIRVRLYPYAGDCLHVLREQGRLLIEDTRGDIDEKAVLPKIQHVFGITAFCSCLMVCDNQLEILKQTALSFVRTVFARCDFSFKVETKRGDKRYPLTSREISSEIGAFLLEHEPSLTVDVHTPQVIVWIELRTRTYIYVNSRPGEGGLPYGASGKAVLLLSGGIDSPVAGYLMARRGVEILPVYFHSPPHTSDRAADKVLDLSRRLAAYTGSIKVYIVPFTDVQIYLYQHVPLDKLTIFLKRAMLSIASLIALRENAHALITGDSVGQVASQTIQSLEAVCSACALPVLRPLAAYDKQHIITTAQAIETYAISIRPYQDCCTLFVAEHPECKPKASVIARIEAKLTQLGALCSAAAKQAQITEIGHNFLSTD